MAERIQRKRTKGWRMPVGAVYVGRPTEFGNPFTITGDWIVWTAVALGFKGDPAGRRAAAIELYRLWLTGKIIFPPKSSEFHGAIGFESGREIPMDEYVGGLAGFMAATVTMPLIPTERPSLTSLRGKDLACWCPLNQPCHADVLLEIANAVDARFTPVDEGKARGSA